MSKKITAEREIRTLQMVELRVYTDGGDSFIEGHAAVFDTWSETLGLMFPFKEKVRKGAFVHTVETDDIRALFNHDPNYVLGRNRAGTLTLYEDEKGLFVRMKPPETTWAKDLMVSIARGDITQMSFGFLVVKDDWRTEDGLDVRELIEVKLYDVSPVTFPAYTATDVGVRAMEAYEQYKAEVRSKSEADEAAAKRAKERRKLSNIKTKIKNL